jgi:hypothetical protein
MCVDVRKAVDLFIEKRRPKQHRANANTIMNTDIVDQLPPVQQPRPQQRHAPSISTAHSTQREEKREEKKEEKKNDEALDASANDGRDAGVSDVDWEELQRVRREQEALMERLRKEKDQRLLEEELARQRAVQERIRSICPCPAGFSWFQVGGGWRCGGGSHFVTQAELDRRFTK